MNKIRIPIEWLKAIVNDYHWNTDKKEWEFVSYGGNKLVAKFQYSITSGPNGNSGPPVEAIDFEYNPQD